MRLHRRCILILNVYSPLVQSSLQGSGINAQDSIPVELPEEVREGATCHVIDGLTLNVDLKLFDESTNEIIPYNEEIHIPEDEAVPGKCTTGSQDLYYVTPDGFLEINMKFRLQDDDDSSVWNLDHFAILVLQPNVSNMAEQKDQFSKRDGMLKQGTTLFRAPVNITYQCTRINSVVYPSNIHSAMIFSQAKLQPYSEYVQISSDRGGYICPRRRRSNIKERSGSGEYLVPIILATSLGIVLLLLVIGYLLLKKIGKLGYQNME